MALTRAGAAYAEAIHGALDQVEQATAALRETCRGRALRIELFPSFAIKWLVSRLAEFRAAHPEIEIQLITTQSPVRLNLEENDFTIQIGAIREPGVRHDPLIAIELLPVCAPSYLRRNGPVGRPADLLQHVLLRSQRRPLDWRL